METFPVNTHFYTLFSLRHCSCISTLHESSHAELFDPFPDEFVLLLLLSVPLVPFEPSVLFVSFVVPLLSLVSFVLFVPFVSLLSLVSFAFSTQVPFTCKE